MSDLKPCEHYDPGECPLCRERRLVDAARNDERAKVIAEAREAFAASGLDDFQHGDCNDAFLAGLDRIGSRK